MIGDCECARVGRSARAPTLFHASWHLHYYRKNPHRKPLFDSDAKLDLFRDTTFEFGEDYALILQAWAFFANHYHLVASFENTETTHRDFVRHLHRELTMRANEVDAAPGRRVMYEFWDTHLTFEKSWLARLNYVHQNPGQTPFNTCSESVSVVFGTMV